MFFLSSSPLPERRRLPAEPGLGVRVGPGHALPGGAAAAGGPQAGGVDGQGAAHGAATARAATAATAAAATPPEEGRGRPAADASGAGSRRRRRDRRRQELRQLPHGCGRQRRQRGGAHLRARSISGEEEVLDLLNRKYLQ